jgi:hypothetical protein
LNTIANLSLKYHDDKAEAGRIFRFLLGGYPAITKEEPADPSSVRLE